MRSVEVDKSRMGTPERTRGISTQAVVIRTMGAPELLRRNLSAIKANLDCTRTASTVSVGIVDDSPGVGIRVANRRVLQEVGIDGHYLNTQETEGGSLLARMRERAVALAQSRGIPESEILRTYQYLLTEQKEMDQPTFLPDMKVGKGSNATCNVATLLGAYILGTAKTPETEGIITHYDNDVIPGLTLRRESGIPTFAKFDQFAERDEHFENPDTLLSAGKYAGIAGDPFGTAVIALQVTNGILDDFQTGDHDEVSPYALYDATSHSFTQITKGEVFRRLPEIIRSFLARAPITGFLTQEDLNFNSPTIKHDGGNFTQRDIFAREVPSQPTGVHEYSILAPLKVLHVETPVEDLIKVETPAIHIREDLPSDVDIHQGGLLSGTFGRIIQHQILLELALQQKPELVNEILQALGSSQVSPDAIDALPKLNTGANVAQTIGKGEPVTKNQRLARVRELRDTITERMRGLSENASQIKESIGMLTGEFNDAVLSSIEQVLSPSAQNVDDIRKMIIAIERYYIPAIKHWPLLYDAAYQVGLEDAT
jgi:hypothetical protein